MLCSPLSLGEKDLLPDLDPGNWSRFVNFSFGGNRRAVRFTHTALVLSGAVFCAW